MSSRVSLLAGIVAVSACALAAAQPPATPLTFTIDSTQDVHPISRFIYGMNAWDPAGRPKNLTLSRSGGNRMTAWNWETNDSNAGADYHNQNDTYLGGGSEPNGAVRPGLEAARNAGAGMIVTMPTIGYVSADHEADGDVANTPNYLDVRFHRSMARKGSAFSLTPDTRDDFVYQDEYVNFLDQTYRGAFASPFNPIMISLDNEPDLWQHTHARLRGDGNPATQNGANASYAEIVRRTIEYASAIKDVNAVALVFGPASYGWQGMVRFQNAPDANDRDFLSFYLSSLAVAEKTGGRRLLDVLDVHWYPEVYGASSDRRTGKTRITEDNIDPGVVAARKQAPRSLWDPTFTEDSWIAKYGTGGPIRLLPRLKEEIAANYPNTRLAVTEYNYGAGGHISGAIAQADVLGIFGREGVFAAAVWLTSCCNDFIYAGFDAYRNFDGAGGHFGGTSVRAVTSDNTATSVYASIDPGIPKRMVVVAINKSDATRTAGFSIRHSTQFRRALAYQVTSAGSSPRRQADLAIAPSNAFQYTMPANSVTTLLLLP